MIIKQINNFLALLILFITIPDYKLTAAHHCIQFRLQQTLKYYEFAGIKMHLSIKLKPEIKPIFIVLKKDFF